ncbi:MAG: Gfo/Idh/MocA family oxidoreductase [Planctomycetes bacterium]|nr:Gfo/Idh/MocA family oxidoreductase [Planctomycetota bacterium]
MPDPAKPLRLLVVGFGGIAAAYHQALQRSPALRLEAVVEPDAARLTPADAPRFASLAAYWQSGVAADAALVLTPPATHEAIALELLGHGLHVLCEKPLAPTIAGAKRMLAAARAAERRLMLGSKFRYTPDVIAAQRLLRAGACGDAVLYENVFCSHVDMTRRWNALPEQSGGGVLIDNGCHSVDVARFLLGPIARVQAMFGRKAQPLAVEDTARLLFTSQGGALGSIDLSWSMHKETDSYVRIHGTKGTLEVGWKASRWKPVGGEWRRFGDGYDKIAAFAGQLADFAAATAGAPGAIEDGDALASVVVIDAAYRSAREARWIDVLEGAR